MVHPHIGVGSGVGEVKHRHLGVGQYRAGAAHRQIFPALIGFSSKTGNDLGFASLLRIKVLLSP
jgi:hypothetical protein